MHMALVNFSLQTEGKAVVLGISGEIDAHSAPDFDKKMKECLAKSKSIIIDAAKLDYISTAGLGVLMASFNTAKAGGGDIVVAGMPDKIKKVFDTMGFSKVLKIASSVSQAKSLL
jgi:anti-sigma B factor antagonist